MRKTLMAAVMVHLLVAGAALADLVDGNGQVMGWGVTPFTQPNQADTFDGSIWMTIENDYAPIDYPGGVGYRPSPGGSTGEAFDLEEMYVRILPGQVQVLLVSSANPSTEAVGNTWYLGDLMITADDQPFGIVTSDLYQGLEAGSIYSLQNEDDVTGLQDHSRSYRGNRQVRANDYGPDATVSDIVGGFAVSGSIDPARLLGTADLETDVFDYGGVEDATRLLQYTFDMSVLGLDRPPETWSAQITWGCGNDVIRVRDDVPQVPEPATFGLLLAGVALTAWARRRRPTGHG